MNFRCVDLGGGVRFFCTWALFEAALERLRSEQRVGLIGCRARLEEMAMDGQARALIEAAPMGRA